MTVNDPAAYMAGVLVFGTGCVVICVVINFPKWVRQWLAASMNTEYGSRWHVTPWWQRKFLGRPTFRRVRWIDHFEWEWVYMQWPDQA